MPAVFSTDVAKPSILVAVTYAFISVGLMALSAVCPTIIPIEITDICKAMGTPSFKCVA